MSLLGVIESAIQKLPAEYMRLPGLAVTWSPSVGKPFLLLEGGVGTWKTTTAINLLIARARALRIIPRFVRYAHLVNLLNDSDRFEAEPADSVVWRFSKWDLLLLDDLGSDMTFNASQRERVISNVCLILEDRGTSGNETIITSNLTLDQVGNILGPRIARRLDTFSVRMKFGAAQTTGGEP